MRSFRELIVVELNQRCDGIINCGQLDQCHLPVLGEKLKCLKNENLTLLFWRYKGTNYQTNYICINVQCHDVCVQFSVLFFSSSLRCNIISMLRCFRKKSYLDLCLGFHDIRLKYQTQKQPQQATSIHFFSFFLSFTFPTQEIVANVLHYRDWDYWEQYHYLPHC